MKNLFKVLIQKLSFYIVPLLIFSRFLDVHQLKMNLKRIKKLYSCMK